MTGIEPLEARGRLIGSMLRQTEISRQWKSPLWSDDQNIELVTRSMLRKDLKELLGGQLTRTQLDELKEVLFTFVYPTDGRKASGQL